jgi:hypothetical protein
MATAGNNAWVERPAARGLTRRITRDPQTLRASLATSASSCLSRTNCGSK